MCDSSEKHARGLCCPTLFRMEFCIVKRGVIVYLLFFFCLDTLPLIIAQIVFIFIFPIIILRSSVWGY